MPIPVVYVWESYPEYHAAQQFSRCLGRILASLPKRLRLKLARPMTQAAILIAHGIAGAHAEVDDASYTQAVRAEMRTCGLKALGACRTTLVTMKEERTGDRANVLAALELLERIEHGMRERPLPS